MTPKVKSYIQTGYRAIKQGEILPRDYIVFNIREKTFKPGKQPGDRNTPIYGIKRLVLKNKNNVR